MRSQKISAVPRMIASDRIWSRDADGDSNAVCHRFGREHGEIMDDRAEREQAPRPPLEAGLCATCRFARVIVSDRGSRFVLCERSKTDPAFSRFPPLPVNACSGYDRDDRAKLSLCL